MKKWKNVEAVLLMVASLIVTTGLMITDFLLKYLLKIGHPAWGIVLGVLGVSVSFIMLFVIYGCGYVSGRIDERKETRND